MAQGRLPNRKEVICERRKIRIQEARKITFANKQKFGIQDAMKRRDRLFSGFLAFEFVPPSFLFS
jgi:hypothetical protein